MAKCEVKVLLVVGDINKLGGVANYYRTIRSKFTHNVEYFIVGSRKGDNILNAPLRIIKDYWRFALKIKNNTYDIVHLNPSLNLKSVVRDGIFLMLCRKSDAKIIVFFRGWSKSFENTISKYFLSIFSKIYFRADRMVVLSNLFKESLQKWGYKGEITVETTIVDDKCFVCDLEPNESADNSSLKLLFLSRIEAKKGIFETLEAFKFLKKKFPGIKLIIAGEGKDAIRAKEIIEELNMADVDFIGYVSGVDKQKVFCDSDIYLFASHEEGMPNSVLEAMAYGLPVVTTPIGGLQDFFINGEMGFMTDNFKSEAIANMTEKLIIDNKLRNKISLINRKYAAQHFAASSVAIRIQKIYEEVIHPNKIKELDLA